MKERFPKLLPWEKGGPTGRAGAAPEPDWKEVLSENVRAAPEIEDDKTLKERSRTRMDDEVDGHEETEPRSGLPKITLVFHHPAERNLRR